MLRNAYHISLIVLSIILFTQSSSTSAFAEDNASLATKVEDLETRLSTLEKAIEDSGIIKEGQAKAAFQPIEKLMKDGNFLDAKARLDSFKTTYGGTEFAKSPNIMRLTQELQVVGKPAPTKWVFDKWFQGESEVSLENKSKPTLLVFWEEWCPHCRREVPKIEKLYQDYKDSGLQVVGVTKVNKSSTDVKVQNFINEQKVKYPIAKEDGSLSSHFGVRGIPAAAMIKDGKVIWRGHPARLTKEMLNAWL